MPGLVLTYAWLAMVLAGPALAGAPAPTALMIVTAQQAAAAATPAETGAPSAAVAVVAAEPPATLGTAADSPASSGASAAQDPDAILRETSRVYEGMRSIRAGFEQEMENRLLGRTTRSVGTFYQRQPDKFLMDFSDPEGDLIVSDGRYFWMYFPSVDAKQVIRMPRRSQGLDLQAQFIGDVTERFDVTYHGEAEVRGRKAWVMTLDPREPMGYRRLKVWIDEEDHLVRRFEITEQNGNIRHMELFDVTVNPDLADSLFEFTPPDDALVVDRG